jgi:hypothetical protein
VVWETSISPKEETINLKKIYGKHLDEDLNKQLEGESLKTSKPRTESLVDPTLDIGEKVFRIGRRIFAFMASNYITEADRIITIENFREQHPDTTVMTDRALKKCFRCLMLLVPEIGVYNSASGEIVLSKRPKLDKIKERLESLQDMDDQQIKVELTKSSRRVKLTTIQRPTKRQKTNLDPWLSSSRFLSKHFIDLRNDDPVMDELVHLLEPLPKESEFSVTDPFSFDYW